VGVGAERSLMIIIMARHFYGRVIFSSLSVPNTSCLCALVYRIDCGFFVPARSERGQYESHRDRRLSDDFLSTPLAHLSVDGYSLCHANLLYYLALEDH